MGTAINGISSARLRAECKHLCIDYMGKTRSDMIVDLKNAGLFDVDTRWPAKPPRIDTSDRSDDLSNLFLGNGAGRYETGANKLYISNNDTTRPLIGGDFKKKVVNINEVLNIAESESEINASTPGEPGDIRRFGSSIYMFRVGEDIHSGWYPLVFGSMVLY